MAEESELFLTPYCVAHSDLLIVYHIILYFNIKIMLWVATRRAKQVKTIFSTLLVIRWCASVESIEFWDSANLNGADTTDQIQYLRNVSFLSWWQDSLITQSHIQVDAGSTNILLLNFPSFDVKWALLVYVLWVSCGFAHLHPRGTCTPNSKKQESVDRQLGCGFLYTTTVFSGWKV